MTWLKVDLSASQNELEKYCTEPGWGDLPVVRQFAGCAKDQHDKPGLCTDKLPAVLVFLLHSCCPENGDMNTWSYPFVIGRATQSQCSAV